MVFEGLKSKVCGVLNSFPLSCTNYYSSETASTACFSDSVSFLQTFGETNSITVNSWTGNCD